MSETPTFVGSPLGLGSSTALQRAQLHRNTLCRSSSVTASLDHPSKTISTARGAAATAAAALIALTAVPSIQVGVGPVEVTADSCVRAAKGGGDTFLASSGKVNKDAESLLRWSLPVSNKDVRELQSYLEEVISDVRGLKWLKMDQDLKRGLMVLNARGSEILKAVPEERQTEAKALLAKVADAVPSVDAAIQEKSADKVVLRDKDLLRNVGRLEELMVKDFPYQVPPEYSNLPQLRGRAEIEVVVAKDGDEQFDINGALYKEGKMTIVVDGYSAPVSAGTFVDLVNKGFYNGLPIIRSDGFIVQTGKPDSADGYVDEKSGEVRTIPLEVFPKGDETPLYGMTLEDDGRGSAPTVLPFSSYGTLAMARKEFEPNSGSSQFFWFLFEPDLTPAGRNLLDGSWSVFGYTIKGESYLKGLQKGDRLVSAKVVHGLENLVNTNSTASTASVS